MINNFARKIKLFCIGILLCSTVFSNTNASTSVFTINTIDIGPSAGKCEFFFSEVFKRLKIKVQFVSLPRVRGINALNNGDIDADCGLSKPFGQRYPNLIAVNEKLNTLNIYLRFRTSL